MPLADITKMYEVVDNLFLPIIFSIQNRTVNMTIIATFKLKSSQLLLYLLWLSSLDCTKGSPIMAIYWHCRDIAARGWERIHRWTPPKQTPSLHKIFAGAEHFQFETTTYI